MSRLALGTLSSLATRKRSKTASSSRYQAHLSYVKPKSDSFLSSSRSSSILLVLGSGRLASTCQRWLTAAGGFGDADADISTRVFRRQLAQLAAAASALQPLAVCAGRPLACVSPTDLSGGSNNPARSKSSSARLPQACCSARTAVRRRRGSARCLALSLHVIGLLRSARPAAQRSWCSQGQVLPFIQDDARRAPARRPRAPGPGRMRGRAARVFPLRWVGRKRTTRKRTTLWQRVG